MKFLQYNNMDTRQYFWRTTQQQEIDLVEDYQEKISAFEFKWGKSDKVRFSQTFTESYKGAETKIITPDNLGEFLLK